METLSDVIIHLRDKVSPMTSGETQELVIDAIYALKAIITKKHLDNRLLAMNERRGQRRCNVIQFWNTTVDEDMNVRLCPDQQLLQFLEELVTHDVWNNGGQLEASELGEFYDRVVQEILDRMSKGVI